MGQEAASLATVGLAESASLVSPLWIPEAGFLLLTGSRGTVSTMFMACS